MNFTLIRKVAGITAKGFWLGEHSPKWSSDRDVFIPRSLIIEADTDLDEVELGQEITVEIPEWLAEREGLILNG